MSGGGSVAPLSPARDMPSGNDGPLAPASDNGNLPQDNAEETVVRKTVKHNWSKNDDGKTL